MEDQKTAESLVGSDNTWDAVAYDSQHSYIWKNGLKLVDLLVPQKGEYILDLGCGTGHITAKIAESGAEVMGVDASSNMIRQAKTNYPHIHYEVADARSFCVPERFDAVFSSATLHWVLEPARAIDCIWKSLKNLGRLVVSLGAQGTVNTITTAIHVAREEVGYPPDREITPWYLPTIGEYTPILEQPGFSVVYCDILGGLTPLDGGEKGIQYWIEMFGSAFLAGVPREKHAEVIRSVERLLAPSLFIDGVWYADYRTLRAVAIKCRPPFFPGISIQRVPS